MAEQITSEREAVKVDPRIMVQVRKIAEREGYVIGRLIDRLLLAGIKAEKLQ